MPSISLLIAHLPAHLFQGMLFQQPAASEAQRYPEFVAVECVFPGIVWLVLNDIGLDQRFERIQDIFAFVANTITSVDLFNFGERKQTAFLFSTFGDGC